MSGPTPDKAVSPVLPAAPLFQDKAFLPAPSDDGLLSPLSSRISSCSYSPSCVVITRFSLTCFYCVQTTGLLATYKLINHRYYEAKKAKAKQGGSGSAAQKEDFSVVAGELLGPGGKYRVEESMGKGSFGQVVSCTHTGTGAKVAVKVIKNKEAFRRQARTEIKLLELLNKKDPEDQWCIGE
jgi:Protein kinase domain